MLPSLQPSRPKPPHPSAHPTFVHQQRRAVHESAHQQQPEDSTVHATLVQPRNQIEAMPPSLPRPGVAPAFYDSAVRHPVFFTQNLKKPPFPIPPIASQGWSPVANGYIMEQQPAMNAEPRTKL
ncbi:hypothetical protein ACEQ8H_007314 [Pleosporales sp. CAS-2024a]